MMKNKKNLILVMVTAAILLSLVLFSGCIRDPQKLYEYHEKKCLEYGWQKIIVNYSDYTRKILWKAPNEPWNHGAIIALHGGGGTYSNWGSNIPIGRPMTNFSELAISEGFAIFALDSTDEIVTDENGYSAGKRFDCIAQDIRPNVDISFLEFMVTDIIPELRQENSSKSIFMTGISNGGFMTILATTHFPDKITAFAPVSAGDPYGTYMDCSKLRFIRPNAPGVFLDRETHIRISQIGAAVSDDYPNEKEWPTVNVTEKPPFKQFHHQDDGLCDISCMEKAQRLLNEHGYIDDGSFILEGTGERNIENHFWKNEYNQPILDFFKNYSNTNYRASGR